MENSVSRILIETTVRQTLKGIQEDPERSIRNLVDMALQFSEGRFQSRFFATAHAWLKNDKSAYYNLIPDAVNHIETEHLVRLGMNIGYNSCTWGARRIRSNERRLGFNIPWAVFLQMEEGKERCDLGRYHWVIQQGEELGIYSWALFAPENPSQLYFSRPNNNIGLLPYENFKKSGMADSQIEDIKNAEAEEQESNTAEETEETQDSPAAATVSVPRKGKAAESAVWRRRILLRSRISASGSSRPERPQWRPSP